MSARNRGFLLAIATFYTGVVAIRYVLGESLTDFKATVGYPASSSVFLFVWLVSRFRA